MSDLESAQPTIDPIDRTVTIGERSLVIRLERSVWEAVDEICQRESLSTGTLCQQAARRVEGDSLAEKIAATVHSYFKDAAQRDQPALGTLGEPSEVGADGKPVLSSVGAEALNAIGPPERK